MSDLSLDIILELLADKLADKLAAKSNGNGNGHATPEPDTLLTVEEAAKRMAVKSRWIYAHAGELKFVVRLPGSRALRCSERGIAKWLQKRMGS